MKNALLLSLLPLALQAAPVDENKALELAQNFVANHSSQTTTAFVKSTNSTGLHLVYTGKSSSAVKSRSGSTISTDPAYYVFNYANDGAYVVVSGEDALKPVLGYSDNGGFSSDKINEGLQWWLDAITASVANARANNLPTYSDTLTTKTALVKSAGAKAFVRYPSQAGPLLGKILFDQGAVEDTTRNHYSTVYSKGAAYNQYCPVSYKMHCYTGCVATAFAQVMRYWQWPTAAATGSGSYWTPDGAQITTSLAGTVFDWANMLPDYNDTDSLRDTEYKYVNNKGAWVTTVTANFTSVQRAAVAKLMFACGQAVNMSYGLNGSSSTTGNIVAAAVDNFGYSKTIGLRPREYFTTAEWLDLIKSEINAKRPVIYSASAQNKGGHAFVCDGYDAYDLVHINWGWGGNNNGYFDVSSLQYEGNNNPADAFSMVQQIIIGIKKPETGDKGLPFMTVDNMTATAGTYAKTASTPVTINGLGNYNYDFSGSLALGFYQNGNLVTTVSAKSTSQQAGLSINSYTLSLKLPSGLAAGTYDVRVVYKQNGESSYTATRNAQGRSLFNKITVTVTSTGFTVANSSESLPNLQIVSTSGFDRPFVKDQTNTISVTFKNTGGEISGDNYDSGNIQFRNESKMLTQGTISVRTGETRTVEFTFVPEETGSHTFQFYCITVGDGTGYWVPQKFTNTVEEASTATPAVTISNVSLTQSCKTPGQIVTLKFTANNTGGLLSQYYVEIYKDSEKDPIVTCFPTCQINNGTYTIEKQLPYVFKDLGTYTVKLSYYGDDWVTLGVAAGYTFTVSPVTVTVSSVGYATAYMSYDATIPTGVTCYTAVDNGDKTLSLTKVTGTVLPALTPVVIQAAAGSYTFKAATTTTTTANENDLQGMLITTIPDANKTYYVLNSVNGVLGFYRYTGATLDGTKAYFMSTTSTIPAYTIRFGGGISTDINAVENGTTSDKYYDMQGRRVVAPTHGIYIKNGKKVVL